eukprot:3139711-Alexandrium_andersonii.AAC.1
MSTCRCVYIGVSALICLVPETPSARILKSSRTMAAAAAGQPLLLPPPLWARCRENAEEAQEQERFCWERVRQ